MDQLTYDLRLYRVVLVDETLLAFVAGCIVSVVGIGNLQHQYRTFVALFVPCGETAVGTQGVFDINNVCDGICKKLIERHPHVFGSVQVDSTEQVLDNWDTIKRKSKQQKTQGEAMQKVPLELPALMRAEKIQKKAKKAGFDWDCVDGAYDALDSEIKELKAAQQSGDLAQIENELGDVLFSVVNVSRFLHVDPEQALTGASNKFLNRYLEVEKLASARGIDMPGTPIEELDKLWNEAKETLKSN